LKLKKVKAKKTKGGGIMREEVKVDALQLDKWIQKVEKWLEILDRVDEDIMNVRLEMFRCEEALEEKDEKRREILKWCFWLEDVQTYLYRAKRVLKDVADIKYYKEEWFKE
jgi:hypothetical protein